VEDQLSLKNLISELSLREKDLSQEQDLPKELPQDLPKDLRQDIPKDLLKDLPQDLPQVIYEDLSQNLRIPEGQSPNVISLSPITVDLSLHYQSIENPFAKDDKEELLLPKLGSL